MYKASNRLIYREESRFVQVSSPVELRVNTETYKVPLIFIHLLCARTLIYLVNPSLRALA